MITESYDESKVPAGLLRDLKKWKWGSYGWVSPASLIFTAAWRKHYFPEIDCCKIWAKDEQGASLSGGYSIRTEDENISIPILSKHELCEDFCSPNSGMQGSRAIEKMRSLKRINVDFDVTQKTVFDLKLFALILNQINELGKEEALEVVKYLILVAKKIKSKRIATNTQLNAEVPTGMSVLNFLSRTADPELTKCVVAASLDVIFSPHGFSLEGVSDHKTAADARAQKPGDLCLTHNGVAKISIEVKDKTQTIDWNNIERAKSILEAHPSLVNFIFVLESREAASSQIVKEMLSSEQLSSTIRSKISVLSLHDIYFLAMSITTEDDIASKAAHFLSITPAVKPETKQKWLTFKK